MSKFGIKGKKVFVRALRYFYVGKVEKVTPDLIYLSNVSIVINVGVTEEALLTGKFKSWGTYPPELISRIERVGTEIVDWNHDLPTKKDPE